MKFSMKILLSMMIVMALALGFSGFYFVNSTVISPAVSFWSALL